MIDTGTPSTMHQLKCNFCQAPIWVILKWEYGKCVSEGLCETCREWVKSNGHEHLLYENRFKKK